MTTRRGALASAGSSNADAPSRSMGERPDLNHDAAEAKAMRQHYAAPAGPDLPSPDPVAVGLARGFHEHRARLAGR